VPAAIKFPPIASISIDVRHDSACEAETGHYEVPCVERVNYVVEALFIAIVIWFDFSVAGNTIT
jgi:hypothetical protein